MVRRTGSAFSWSRAGGLLAIALILLAADAVQAQTPSEPAPPEPPPSRPSTPSSRPRRNRTTSDINWPVLILGLIGGGSILAAVVVFFINEKKKKAGGSSAAAAAKKKETPDPLATGEIGGYRLLNLMMTGQTSQVWEVAEIKSGRHFALKILLPEHAKNNELRKMLFYEAEVCKQLEHPNIIRIVSVNKSSPVPYFLMEFFPGGNLKFRVMRKETEYLRLHITEILKQVATALAFTNSKGWVHRDIKPDNILVNAVGEARVIDFAIAYKIPSGIGAAMHRKGKTAGTRSYMSPEQIRDDVLDGRADIYSFGCTVYELVTSRPPFRAASPADLLNKHLTEKPLPPKFHNTDLTDEFSDYIIKMISKKRDDRPNNFHEVLIALKKMRIFKSGTLKNPNADSNLKAKASVANGSPANSAIGKPAVAAEKTTDKKKA